MSESILGSGLKSEIKELIREVLREEVASHGAGALLTAEQLAEQLQVHPATIYTWVKADAIPYYQSGRFIRFNLNEVLESQRKKSPCKV